MLVSCVHSSRGSSQCCNLHDLQFVNAGRGCKRMYMEELYSRVGLMAAL